MTTFLPFWQISRPGAAACSTDSLAAKSAAPQKLPAQPLLSGWHPPPVPSPASKPPSAPKPSEPSPAPCPSRTPSRRRQAQGRRPGSVLLAQITAAGAGLNIQSASVVILAEPQFKPTIEAQAIARAHRMGQTHAVDVYRLLGANTVDERMIEILSLDAAAPVADSEGTAEG
ncbi:C-terminal helicase domain-containing protein [Rothia nasimurium]|uniref:C-terminal helicase domain-containing protein n=1 Tax=Rothia nasimurium TaxID=85336 RepID=UPI001ADD6F26|nr:helicase-related protein [Rothia nasimurium]